MSPSRSVNVSRFLGRAAVCASLMVMCLQAGAASALSFNFQFSGIGTPTNPATVTGIVEGLVDNLNDQKTGVTVTITSATNGPSGTVFTDADILDGDGFDVTLGQVEGVDIWYENAGGFSFYLGNQNGFSPEYTGSSFFNYDDDFTSANSLVFTPVPGPLPIFGASATFAWSRKLRRRMKFRAES